MQFQQKRIKPAPGRPWSVILHGPSFRRCLQLGLAAILLSTAPARAGFELYVSNSGDNTIRKFDAAGNMTVFATNGVNGLVDVPVGLVADNLGNMYVVNQNPDNIERYDALGHGTNFVNLGATSFAYGGMAMDGSNNLVVAIGANIFKHVSPSGTVSVLNGFAPYLNNPLGLTFDDTGNLYAVNTGNSVVEKFTYPATNATAFITNVPNPTTVAFDSTGNVYVASGKFGAVAIMKFDTNGSNGTVFVSGFKSGLNQPRGMAFDSAGNLYVADVSLSRIFKFDPTGTTNGNGSVFADATKGLSQPIFIVIREPSRYSDDWFKVAGGGGTSAGAGASVSGTIGEYNAGGAASGGSYSLTGGFWSLYAVAMPGAPKLFITVSGANAILTWSASATGYLLESSSNISVTNGWSVVSTPPISVNGFNYVTNTITPGRTFYRLHYP